MSGIQINDTYGPLFGIDQMCDCTFAAELRIGDKVFLETDAEPLQFTVALIETYQDADGVRDDIMGVGLNGPDSDFVMPGDTLARTFPRATRTHTFASQCIELDEDLHIEVHRSLVLA